MELAKLIDDGKRAVLCYCVQRASANEVVPAEDFDPTYAENLRKAAAAGVEIIAYKAFADEQGLLLKEQIPVRL